MSQTSGDLSHKSREELYSLVNALKRQINCLSTDLLRFKLISNKCRKYIKYLRKMSPSFDPNIDNYFMNEMNVLKDTKLCAIGLKSDKTLNDISNLFNQRFVSIGCQTSDEFTDQLTIKSETIITRHETQDTNRLSAEEVIQSDNESEEGIDCDINYVSNEMIIDGQSVDGNDINSNEDIVDTELIESQDMTSIETQIGSELKTKSMNNCETNTRNTTQMMRSEGEVNTETDINDNNPQRSGEDIDDETIDTTEGKCDSIKSQIISELKRRSENNSQTNATKRMIKIIGFDGRVVADIDDNDNIRHTNSEQMGDKSVVPESMRTDRLIDSENRELLDDEYNCHSSDEEINDNSDTDSQQIVVKRKNKKYNFPKIDGKFVCDYEGCGKAYRDPQSVAEHQRSHSGERLFCDYKGCINHFGLTTSLNTHKRLGRHLLGEAYRCHHYPCSYTTTSRRQLLEHVSGHPLMDRLDKKSRHYCDYENCGKTYSDSTALKEHLMWHSGDRFYCDYGDCTAHFGQRPRLLLHRKSGKHLSGEPYRCSRRLCSFETTSCPELRQHLADHSREETASNVPKIGGKYRCDYDGCGQEFRVMATLREHRRDRHLGKRFFCDHPNCSAHYSSSHALVDHQKTGAHVLGQPFSCQFKGCAYQTPEKENFEEHLAITHSGPAVKYRCDQCPYTAGTRGCLLAHQSLKHGTKYRCSEPGCEYSTGRKSFLDNHLKIFHSNDYPFKCDIDGCDKTFKLLVVKTAHQLTQHPDAYPDIPWIECPHTGCQFRSKYKHRVNTHERSHTKPFQCSVCKRRFGTKNSLTDHSLTHNESLKYRCEWHECDESFTRHSDMRDHYNKHTRAVVYRCEWPGCEKEFIHRTSLIHHRRRHKMSEKVDYRCHWPECEYSTKDSRNLKTHIDRHNGVVKDRRRSRKTIKTEESVKTNKTPKSHKLNKRTKSRRK